MFQLKNVKISAILAAFMIIVFAFSACNLFHNSGNENSVPSSSTPAVVTSSSQPNSSTPSNPPTDSSVSGIVTPGTDKEEQVIPIVTDNKDFDKKFAQNPIDAAYKSDSEDALSNADIIRVSDKYADIWHTEIDSAYKKLLSVASDTDKKKFKTEQENWVNGSQAALKKIASDAQAEGGSMAQVQNSSKVMAYSRSRAAAIYGELYNFDKNYSYQFKK